MTMDELLAVPSFAIAVYSLGYTHGKNSGKKTEMTATGLNRAVISG